MHADKFIDPDIERNSLEFLESSESGRPKFGTAMVSMFTHALMCVMGGKPEEIEPISPVRFGYLSKLLEWYKERHDKDPELKTAYQIFNFGSSPYVEQATDTAFREAIVKLCRTVPDKDYFNYRDVEGTKCENRDRVDYTRSVFLLSPLFFTLGHEFCTELVFQLNHIQVCGMYNMYLRDAHTSEYLDAVNAVNRDQMNWMHEYTNAAKYLDNRQKSMAPAAWLPMARLHMAMLATVHLDIELRRYGVVSGSPLYRGGDIGLIKKTITKVAGEYTARVAKYKWKG